MTMPEETPPFPLPPEDAPMVTCGKCGNKYKQGGPHAMFCAGNVPKGSECVECGMSQDDGATLSECDCGDIVCDCCKEDGTHDCGF
jgi:hypothetical protein